MHDCQGGVVTEHKESMNIKRRMSNRMAGFAQPLNITGVNLYSMDVEHVSLVLNVPG